MVIYVRHWQRDQLGGVFPFHLLHRDDEGILLWAPASTRGWLFNMPDGRRLPETPLASWSSTPRVPVPHPSGHATLSWHPTARDYSLRWFFHPDGTFARWYGNLEAPAALSPNFPPAGLAPPPAGGLPPPPAARLAPLPVDGSSSPAGGFSPSPVARPTPRLADGSLPADSSRVPAADSSPSPGAVPSLSPGADLSPSPGDGVPWPSPGAADQSGASPMYAAFLDTVDWDLDVVIHPDRTWAWKDEDVFTKRLTQPESYWVHDEPRVRKAGLSIIALAESGNFPFDGTWCDFRPDPSWPPLPSELPPHFNAPPHW
ncbi:hypothetical protein [Actinoplanes sp. NPDC049265]|uniref:hypothetical protein n=1 Tax=Actinoplanes sp. NPDC049265 TaxID=3363902 RepID=UPI0037231546